MTKPYLSMLRINTVKDLRSGEDISSTIHLSDISDEEFANTMLTIQDGYRRVVMRLYNLIDLISSTDPEVKALVDGVRDYLSKCSH